MNNNNNNRNNNNRRRGRGNSRPNGGQPINRIDSRARGNAPQMLEKYRKMALDSHMNGDRVNEEYYLQFADHYFRVIADTRVRQEEARGRRDDRWQEGGTETGTEREFDYAEDAIDPYDDMRQGGGERQDRYERPERQERPERPDRQERPYRERGDRPGQDRPGQDRDDRPQRIEPAVVAEPVETLAAMPSSEADARTVYEPAANPFVRGDREGRGLKQRRPRRAVADEQIVAPMTEQSDDGVRDGPSALDVFDPAILPPAVVPRRSSEADPAEAATDSAADAANETADEAPKPRRRTRRPRVTDAPDGGPDGALQAVS